MSPKADELITEEQMFDALSNAQQLYDRYLELQSICPDPQSSAAIENYSYDMSHPLTIAIKDTP